MSDSIQTSVWLGKSLAVVFARVALFDLCRVSFVERDSSGKYGGGDGVVNEYTDVALVDLFVKPTHERLVASQPES
jgi:hypothetical protein